MNVKLIIIAATAILINFIQFTWAAITVKNAALTDQILTNTKSTVGKPCSVPYDEYIRPLMHDPLDMNDAQRLPPVSSCTAENNEMCGFKHRPKNQPRTATVTDRIGLDNNEPSKISADLVPDMFKIIDILSKIENRNAVNDTADLTVVDPEDPNVIGINPIDRIGTQLGLHGLTLKNPEGFQDTNYSKKDAPGSIIAANTGSRQIVTEPPPPKLHHDYLNVVFPDETEDEGNNNPKTHKAEGKYGLLKSGEHVQLASESQLALDTDDNQIDAVQADETVDSSTPAAIYEGECRCAYRNEYHVGMKLILEPDEHGICRGPPGFPCKSLYLGKTGGEEGHNESCLSGICDMEADMCTSIGAILEDSTDGGIRTHESTHLLIGYSLIFVFRLNILFLSLLT